MNEMGMEPEEDGTLILSRRSRSRKEYLQDQRKDGFCNVHENNGREADRHMGSTTTSR